SFSAASNNSPRTSFSCSVISIVITLQNLTKIGISRLTESCVRFVFKESQVGEVDVRSFFGIIGGAIIGAGAMYLADPVQGRRRRGLVRDNLVHLGKVTTRTAHNATHDVSNRVKGIVQETTRIVRHEPVDDAKLGDRVRSAVGRVSSHPNVEVLVSDGH